MNQTIKQPEEFNLKNIFIGSEYIIPIYQRNYAWEKDEIEQLLTDIYDSKGRYYLGSLIIDEIAPNTFSVIDGQQRLTTLFLLLTFLRDETLSKKALRFEAREKSNFTLNDLREKHNLEKDGFYSNEIIDGFDVIQNYFSIQEVKNQEYKHQFISKFENILIIRTQVPKQIDLNHYFEIMNTRGEQLELHEIAKGKILGVIDRDIPNFKAIAGLIWNKCSQMDSYIQMNFDKTSRKNLFGDNWDNFICNKPNDLLSKISLDQELSDKRYSLLDKLETPVIETETNIEEDYENERFESIISFPNFLLIVNEALQKDSGEDDSSLDDKKFLETLKLNWSNGTNAINFIYNLLKFRFLFDKYIIKREYAKDYKEEGKWSLQMLQMYYDKNKRQEKPSYKLTYAVDENDIDKKTETLRSLQSALRITYTSPKTMHWISKTLAQLNNNLQTDLTSLLEEYACKKILEANYKEASGFGIDRIVFTYLDYVLDRDSICKHPIQNFQFQFRTSIEHFYPQHPIEKEKWKEQPLNSFGNLALITVSSNSKFSNLDPQSKVASYPDTIKQSPKLQLMQEKMQENDNIWNEELVNKHKEEMLSLLTKEIDKYKKA